MLLLLDIVVLVPRGAPGDGGSNTSGTGVFAAATAAVVPSARDLVLACADLLSAGTSLPRTGQPGHPRRRRGRAPRPHPQPRRRARRPVAAAPLGNFPTAPTRLRARRRPGQPRHPRPHRQPPRLLPLNVTDEGRLGYAYLVFLDLLRSWPTLPATAASSDPPPSSILPFSIRAAINLYRRCAQRWLREQPPRHCRAPRQHCVFLLQPSKISLQRPHDLMA